MFTLPPPPALRPTPESEEDTEPPKRKLAERLLDFVVLVPVAGLFLLGISQLQQARAIALPEVPANASRLERIEVLAMRASAIAEANQYLILATWSFALGSVAFVVVLKLDGWRAEMRDLATRNESLRELVDEINERDLEAERNAEKFDRDLAELRKERDALMSRFLNANLQLANRRRLFDDPDDGDEEDESPLFPPQTKPPILN